MVNIIELNIGRDLQYIRLNGTFIGGLAGLGLYASRACSGVALAQHGERPTQGRTVSSTQE